VQEAVAGEKAYAGALSSSMALVLEEFYRNITAVAVSAVTGRGMDELLDKIRLAGEEYQREFRPMLEAKARLKAQRENKAQQRKLKLMREQMAAAAAQGGPQVGGSAGLGAAVGVGSLSSVPARSRHAADAEEEDSEDSEEEGSQDGRRYSLGGIKAFEPDSDSEDDDGEDDNEYLREVPPPRPPFPRLHSRDGRA